MVTYTGQGFTWGRSVYVHYMLRGHEIASRRVGAASGACGRLHARMRMFAFRPVAPGSYRLVFNNRRRPSDFRPNAFFRASVRTFYR